MSEPEKRLEELLRQERPVPSPGFRARLHAMLLSPGDWPSAAPETRPARPPFGRLAISYAAVGAACLLIALAGVAGAGPFAA